MDLHVSDESKEATGGPPITDAVRQPNAWAKAEYAVARLVRVRHFEAAELLRAIFDAVCSQLDLRDPREAQPRFVNDADAMRLLNEIAEAIGPAAYDYSDEAVAQPAYDGAPSRTAYERLPGIVGAMVRRSKTLREVKSAPGETQYGGVTIRGAIDVIDPEDGHSHMYVPVSEYTNALRAANEIQTQLETSFSDRLIAIAEEGWRIGSLSRNDVRYLRDQAEKIRQDFHKQHAKRGSPS